MRYLYSVLFILTFTAIHAQQNYFYINWDYNVPLSSTDWIDQGTGRGGKVGYRAFLGETRRISVGLDINWTTFDQYQPTETFYNPTGAITTDYFKYIDQYGAVASGQYYFPVGERKLILPYVGLGLGANYNEYRILYNIYEDNDSGWGFLARPEAGILVRFGTRRSIGAMAAIHYDFSTNSSDQFDYSNFSSVGFQLGLMFMNRY